MAGSLLLALLGALALSWAPGWGLLRLLGARLGDEAAAAAWPVSWAIVGGLHFAGFVFDLPAGWHLFTILSVCVTLGVYGLRAARPALSSEMARVLALGLAGVAGTASLAVLAPVYDALPGWFGDWWMHFDIARYYLGQRSGDVVYFGLYTIPSRFPLFNLVEAAFLSIFGDHFGVYQVTATIPLAGLLSATYLAVRVWLGSRAAVLAAALLLLNPFIIQNALTPWPKVMAGACILAGLSFYLRRGTPGLPAWAFFTGLGILAHQGSVVIALAVILHALVSGGRAALKSAAVSVMIMAGILAPWLLWAAATFGPAAIIAAAPTVSAQVAPIGSLVWLGERMWNLAGTLAPLTLGRAAVDWLRAGLAADLALGVYGAVLRYSYAVLPGAVTTGLCLTLLAGWRAGQRLPASVPEPRRNALASHSGNSAATSPGWQGGLVLWLCAAGVAGGIILQPGMNRAGLAAESLLPVVVLLVGAAAHHLQLLPTRWRTVALGALAAEFVATRGLHTLLLATGIAGSGSDPNRLLKLEQGIQFIADVAAWEKGVAVACSLALWLTVARYVLRLSRP